MLDRKPNVFRIILLVPSLLLLALAFRNLEYLANSAHGQNLFAGSAGTVYVLKALPGKLDSIFQSGSLFVERKKQGLQPGDLLLAVNGKRVHDKATLAELLSQVDGSQQLKLQIQRPTRYNLFLSYLVSRNALTLEHVRDIPPTGYIFDVSPGGVSDQAGLKPADLIYQIDGKGFGNEAQALALLKDKRPGDLVTYGLIRNGQFLDVSLPMARIDVSYKVVVMVVFGLVLFVFGLGLGLLRPSIKAARLTAVSTVLLGVFFMLGLHRDAYAHSAFTVLRRFCFWSALFFGAAVWFHSRFYFPREQEVLAKRKTHLFLYLIAGTFALAGMFFGPNPALAGMVLLVGTYVYLVQTNPSKKTSCDLAQARLVHWTGLGVLTSAFLLGTVQQGNVAGVPLWWAVPVGFFPFAYVDTIARYRLLDIPLRISRNLQYSFLSGLWVLFVITAMGWLVWALADLERVPRFAFSTTRLEIRSVLVSSHSTYALAFMMVCSAISALMLALLLSRGLVFLKRHYHREQHDYQRVSNALSELMSAGLSSHELGEGICVKLTQMMFLKKVGVLFFRKDGDCYCQESYGLDDDPGWKTLCALEGGELVEALNAFRGELSVDYLPQRFKHQFRDAGFRIVFPIHSKEQLVGCLMIGDKRSETPYSQDDLAFLAAATRQAGIAIENTLLYEKIAGQERIKHELEIARHIQLSSLPQKTPQVPGLDIAGASRPALEVGGDYYDYFQGNRFFVLVGDVSGKGTSAALYMSKFQGILNALYQSCMSPASLLEKANPILYNSLQRNYFITAVSGAFDPVERHLTVARAGHLPVLHYRVKSGDVAELAPRGLGLAVENRGLFSKLLAEQTVDYEPGDLFMFYSDGLSEAMNEAHEDYGETQIKALLVRHAEESAASIRDKILASVSAYSGEAEQHDDQTLVIVKACCLAP